jgi:hypothetical protein
MLKKFFSTNVQKKQDIVLREYSPAFFTGKPFLYDSLYELDVFMKRYDNELKEYKKLGDAKENFVWMNLSMLKEEWKFSIPGDDYSLLLSKLKALHKIQSLVNDAEMSKLLDKFKVSKLTNMAECTRKEPEEELLQMFGW